MAKPTCSDIMKVNLRTICEDDDVSLAIAEMSHDEIRHLIVVDHAGRLVGVVSDRDLLDARDRKIGEVMSRDVQAVGPATPASYAVERMLCDKHSALPVVDHHGRPIGIVTSTDFLDIAYRALVGLDPHVQRARA